jgi:hypothetical protein
MLVSWTDGYTVESQSFLIAAIVNMLQIIINITIIIISEGRITYVWILSMLKLGDNLKVSYCRQVLTGSIPVRRIL